MRNIEDERKKKYKFKQSKNMFIFRIGNFQLINVLFALIFHALSLSLRLNCDNLLLVTTPNTRTTHDEQK